MPPVARLDGGGSTLVDVFCGGRTVQERMAHSVSDKLWDMGAVQSGLRTALEGTEEDMAEAIRNACWSVATDAEAEMLNSLGGWDE